MTLLLGCDDIYFEANYHRLYLGKTGEYTAFDFNDGEHSFRLPLIKEAFNPSLGVQGFDGQSAYGYGGPITSSTDKSFLEAAWQSVLDQARKNNIAAFFVRFHPLLNNHEWVADSLKASVMPSNEVVVRSLKVSEEAIWNDYDSNTRSNIRRSLRESVEVVVSNEPQALEDFRQMYYRTMDQIGAGEFYYFDEQYFKNLITFFKDKIKVYMAYHQGKAIAGSLVFIGNDVVHYHLSANVKEFRKLEAASLLRHQVIMDHLNQQWSAVLFGGGRSNKPDDPLFKFKKGFSLATRTFYIGKFIVNPVLYQQVCQTWEQQYPDKNKSFAHYFLKYKM